MFSLNLDGAVIHTLYSISLMSLMLLFLASDCEGLDIGEANLAEWKQCGSIKNDC